MKGGHEDWKKDLPYRRRWRGYIVLKLAILVLAIWAALRYFGVL
ncbi:MAG: hypothetical protein AB7L41_11880 [Flavobacteriaceae bacterium]